jgi:alpha-D-ribose 1-methylphosphonate 5-triphosphate synthase subunit PhnG
MTNAIDAATGRRQQWLGVLARASRDELEACAATLQPPPLQETVRPAEIGMVMLRGRVGGTGDAFNVGEASLVRCAIRVGAALGVGYSLGRDKRKAELIALLDALLQDEARTAHLMRDVVQPLQRGQQDRRDTQSRAAASSKVDFFTLVRGEA